MTIEGLYIKYNELIGKDLSYEEIKETLKKYIINQYDVKEMDLTENIYTNFTKKITDDIFAGTKDQAGNYINIGYKLSNGSGYSNFDYPSIVNHELKIKLLIPLSLNKRKKFAEDYAKFSSSEFIHGGFKVRNDSISSDTATITINSSKNVAKALEFVKPYVDEYAKQCDFIPMVDGVGVIIDNDDCYFDFIVDGIMKYFNKSESISQVSKENFISYMIYLEASNGFDPKYNKSIKIYNTNLLYSLTENNTIEEIMIEYSDLNPEDVLLNRKRLK